MTVLIVQHNRARIAWETRTTGAELTPEDLIVAGRMASTFAEPGYYDVLLVTSYPRESYRRLYLGETVPAEPGLYDRAIDHQIEVR